MPRVDGSLCGAISRQMPGHLIPFYCQTGSTRGQPPTLSFKLTSQTVNPCQDLRAGALHVAAHVYSDAFQRGTWTS